MVAAAAGNLKGKLGKVVPFRPPVVGALSGLVVPLGVALLPLEDLQVLPLGSFE